MENTTKKKMSLRKYLIIWIPLLAILLALTIAATAVMSIFAGSLDTYLGKGERVITTVAGSEDWDLDYYDSKYSTDEGESGSQIGASKVAKRISDEGEVLMKNNGVLPLKEKAKVTPFGYRYIAPVYGGTGSGNVNVSHSYVSTAQSALTAAFTVNSDIQNIIEKATPYELTSTDRKEAKKQPNVAGFTGAGTSVLEFNPSIYASASASCTDTTGIIFIGRIGGEGSDLQTTKYYDETPHQLALSEYEKNTIKFAKEHCKNTVVIVNSSNVMELTPLLQGEYEADAILWIGAPGGTGFASMAEILCGKVNPSGKTPDIYAKDHTKDPTYINFGTFDYTNMKTGLDRVGREDFAFVEYEENIYIGYRYYETRAEVDSDFKYEDNVAFPFGYGLSYTEFKQSIVDFSDNNGEISVTVKVENTGNVSGKDVVEIYYSAPYTEYDEDNGIEKSSVVLGGFAKTNMIAPNNSDKVTVTFRTEDMASYSHKRTNPDGTKGAYLLEAGDYTISLRSDSHSVIDTRTTTVKSNIWYDSSNPRQSEKDAQSSLNKNGTPTGTPAKAAIDSSAKFIAASNRFEELNEYMSGNGITNMTRRDFKGTFPTAPTEFVASDKIKNKVNTKKENTFDIENDSELGNAKGSLVYHENNPTSKAERKIVLSSLRGLDYYDGTWDLLLDQIDYGAKDELNKLLLSAAFKTYNLTSVGKPETIDHDGPQGFSLTGQPGNWGAACSWCAYPSSPVMAATYNTELGYDMGEAIGQEALATGITGWYAPGVNTHRSPFGGRCFEYYSEDSLLSGKICAAVTSGSADCGVIAYVKHFVGNEQETKRAQALTWMNEQTMREIYLRPFEIYVKEARMTMKYIADKNGTQDSKTMRGALGIMTSMNYLGTRYAGCSYNLVTEILRNEWGFQGAVITDMTGQALDEPERAMRAGTDMWMWYKPGANEFKDTESATAQWAIRNAIHNICYVTANSNIMQNAAPGAIVSYKMSPWMIGLIIADVLIFGFIIVMGVFVVLRITDTQKHPEKYRN